MDGPGEVEACFLAQALGCFKNFLTDIVLADNALEEGRAVS